MDDTQHETRAKLASIEEMTQEEAAAIAGNGEPETVEIELSMHDLMVQNSQMSVQTDPETGVRALLVGPILLRIALPLTAEAARVVARDLAGGIETTTPAQAARLGVRLPR